MQNKRTLERMNMNHEKMLNQAKVDEKVSAAKKLYEAWCTEPIYFGNAIVENILLSNERGLFNLVLDLRVLREMTKGIDNDDLALTIMLKKNDERAVFVLNPPDLVDVIV